MSDNNGREWQILEKAVMASVDEQRKARRWRYFLNY
jgi:protease-4